MTPVDDEDELRMCLAPSSNRADQCHFISVAISSTTTSGQVSLGLVGSWESVLKRSTRVVRRSEKFEIELNFFLRHFYFSRANEGE